MAKIIHNDGYINTVLGHGMKQTDPFAMGKFGGVNSWLVDYREADNMYTFNGLARRIISLPADDALRKGFDINNSLILSASSTEFWTVAYNSSMAAD